MRIETDLAKFYGVSRAWIRIEGISEACIAARAAKPEAEFS